MAVLARALHPETHPRLCRKNHLLGWLHLL